VTDICHAALRWFNSKTKVLVELNSIKINVQCFHDANAMFSYKKSLKIPKVIIIILKSKKNRQHNGQ
jgi:hypothetical protein